MKILFLDVDGVLNSTRSTLARTGVRATPSSKRALKKLKELCVLEDDDLPYGPKFTLETIDPVAVDLVNRLLEKSGAKPVLSTSHRSMFLHGGEHGNPSHIHLLNLYFRAIGIEHQIYDITPRLYVNRGIEIQDWLEACDDDVTHYVILDDGKDFFSHQNLVYCDPDIGFSSQNYYDACKHLGVVESMIIY